jgi:DEAD/DEAH box helicase domain-containing protein
MRTLNDLRGKNIVVYDLEIKATIEEAGGWRAYSKMGVSVGCAFDYRSMRYRVFMDDNLTELVLRLNEPSTLIIAFNHISFDNPLLRASCDVKLKPDNLLHNFDMLLVSRRGAGPGLERTPGFKLDDHLEALRLPKKTGDGAMAPLLWKQGKIGQLVDYCCNDVYCERNLFENMWMTGKTASAYNFNGYPIELPKIEGVCAG